MKNEITLEEKRNKETWFRYGQESISEYYSRLDNIDKSIIYNDFLMMLPEEKRKFTTKPDKTFIQVIAYPTRLNNIAGYWNRQTREYEEMIPQVLIQSLYIWLYSDDEMMIKLAKYLFNMLYADKYDLKSGMNNFLMYMAFHNCSTLINGLVAVNIALGLTNLESIDEITEIMLLLCKMLLNKDLVIETINKIEPDSRYSKRLIMNLKLGD